MADLGLDGDELAEWYDHLYGEVEDGWLSFFAVDRSTGETTVRWCRATDLESTVAITRELNAHGDVWNGVAVRTHRTSGRGGATECGWITALWSDIDFVDAGHAGNSLLPPDEQAAKELVRQFPVPPTAVVHSGGGLQAWHLLDEPVAVDDLGDLLESYGATWARIGRDAGYHVDNVFDLARIMRAPGTLNRKLDQARPVRLLFADWTRRHGVADLRDRLDDPPEPKIPEPSKRDVPYIGPDRPGDEFGARHDGHELLTAHGFHTPTRDSYGNFHYRAPHRGTKDQTGATVYAEDGHITIWSETFCARHPALKVRHGYDVFGLYVALEHGGDFSAATVELRRKGYGSPPADHNLGVPAVTINTETGEIVLDAQRPAVTVYWTDEVAADPPPRLTEIVTNLVAIGEVSVFGAPRAMGKTWATMALASSCAVGHGLLFGSDLLRVTQPTRVVYLQGELGLSASHVRWDLATGGNVPRIAEVFERLRVKTVSRRITQSADGVTWTDEESAATIDHRLEPMLTEMGCELLVMDPWATYYAGNENSNDEVEAAIDAITQMARRVGCAVWIVHHISAKASHGNLAEPEDLWRGASRLADAVSTRVTMLPHYTPAKARELGMDRFQARTFGDLHILQRNGPPVPVIHTQLERFQWRHWEPTDPEGGRPVAVHDEDIVRALRAAGGSITSKRSLADRVGVKSLASLDRSVERLRELGVIDIEPGARGAHLYRLNEQELPPR